MAVELSRFVVEDHQRVVQRPRNWQGHSWSAERAISSVDSHQAVEHLVQPGNPPAELDLQPEPIAHRLGLEWAAVVLALVGLGVGLAHHCLVALPEPCRSRASRLTRRIPDFIIVGSSLPGRGDNAVGPTMESVWGYVRQALWR